jgi:ribonucleoside-diphosphate reductase alpha chain
MVDWRNLVLRRLGARGLPVPSSDTLQLHLIRESLVRPEAEEEAKRLLLEELYGSVRKSYRGRAPNGGLLAELPRCVTEGKPCPDDLRLTYNALRVLLARYVVRDEHGIPMETPSMVLRRVALGFAKLLGRGRAEKLYRMLVEGRFIFNSPTLFNMFVDGAHGTLSACYVTPVYDDMEAIMDAARVQAMTFKWGGGQGFSFSELRPRWDTVRGTSGVASGPISFMRLYDVTTDVVKQGGKRRGANMGILHAWHPDIYTPGFDPWAALASTLPPVVRRVLEAALRLVEEVERDGYRVADWLREALERLAKPQGYWSVEDAGFIQAKEPPLGDTFLTNFNISVGANDAFMEAVFRDAEWWMVNPRYSDRGDGVYRIHYSVSRATGLGRLGKLVERFPWLLDNPYLNIYEDVLEEALRKALSKLEEASKLAGFRITPDQKNPHAWKIRARFLWDRIVENAWRGGDPGLFFPDNHNKWSPTPWLGVVTATNPCAEQPLYPFESCNLGSMALDKYVRDGVFDLEAFYQDVQLAVDAMDAVIDLNKHPDPRQEEANRFTRKIGLGVMGLADALARLGIPYDSEEAVAFTLIVMAALEVFAWKRSWELGAEKGHAPAFECRRYDWRTMKCLEKASPEELVELHTPALVKAGSVASVEDGWLVLRYHSVEVTDGVASRLIGEASKRVGRDGSIRLVRWEAVERVLEKVFGVTRRVYDEARNLPPERAANDPKTLLALAVYEPLRAWQVLREYGWRLGARAPRNTVVTTTAPTGTVSIVAGTSSGIEPYFALVYRRRVTVGEFIEVVRPFRDRLLELSRKHGVPTTVVAEVYEIVAKHKGSLRWALPEIVERLEGRVPDSFIQELEKLAKLFPMSMDFDPWYHVAHQAAAQLYVDQAISKTVNLPRDAPVNAVHTVYLVAWLAGLRGVTVYRDESKSAQVIYFGGVEAKAEPRVIVERPSEVLARPRPNPVRMVHLRKRMRAEEAQRDPKLSKLFRLRETGQGEVVVELTQNSGCRTCET